jgi:hypothetical protein
MPPGELRCRHKLGHLIEAHRAGLGDGGHGTSCGEAGSSRFQRDQTLERARPPPAPRRFLVDSWRIDPA